MEESFVAHFDFLKATKNTFRFQEYGSDAERHIETLYIKQRAFKAQPKKIKATIEVIE